MKHCGFGLNLFLDPVVSVFSGTPNRGSSPNLLNTFLSVGSLFGHPPTNMETD